MKFRKTGKLYIGFLLAVFLFVSVFLSGCFGTKRDSAGDESDSEYNYLQEAISEADSIREAEASFEDLFIPGIDRMVSEAELSVQNIAVLPIYRYKYLTTKPVDGRQGIAWARGDYYISGNQTISHYDRNWDLVATCVKPFKDIDVKVNHISDIDIYQGEIYAGVELFKTTYALNFMIAVYDAETFELKRTYPIARGSGLREISGITVDYDTKSIWVSSWVNERTGEFVYRYDLETGDYIERKHIKNHVPYIQGVAYYNGSLYFSADDGDAALGEPDHLYRCPVDLSLKEFTLVCEKKFDYVMYQGEIEGLDFDPQYNRLLLCYNRGVLIPEGYLFEVEPERDEDGNILPMTEEYYYEELEKIQKKYNSNYHGVFLYELEPRYNRSSE